MEGKKNSVNKAPETGPLGYKGRKLPGVTHRKGEGGKERSGSERHKDYDESHAEI